MIEYGLKAEDRPDYEIDHLLPLELGGADDERNLWPEPRQSIEPTWNAARKDELENKLHAMVCLGEVDIETAQQAILDDWTQAWKVYVGGN